MMGRTLDNNVNFVVCIIIVSGELTFIVVIGFIEVPLPVIVAVGDEAVFRCQHAHANAIEWNINGTSLGDFHPLNITQMIPLSSSETYTLSIQALASYNQTSVECVAFLDTTRLQREESSSVLLFIQGLTLLCYS